MYVCNVISFVYRKHLKQFCPRILTSAGPDAARSVLCCIVLYQCKYHWVSDTNKGIQLNSGGIDTDCV